MLAQDRSRSRGSSENRGANGEGGILGDRRIGKGTGKAGHVNPIGASFSVIAGAVAKSS